MISSAFSTGSSSSGQLEGLYLEEGVLRFSAFAGYPELLHGLSTRCGPGGEDWNLSSKRGTAAYPASIERAIRNREMLAEALGIAPGRMVSCRQVHGSEVVVVGAGEAGRGIYPELGPTPDADAMVTDTPGIYLLALSADCPPVLFYDPVRRVVGLAHSGWKGTVARIAANVVEAMGREYGSEPGDIRVVVGPGIGPCCYRVGENVIEAALESFGAGAWLGSEKGGGGAILVRDDEGVFFSLRDAIRTALVEAGVAPDNVGMTGACTAHNTGVFYSHRAEAGECGLFGAVLGMREG